MLSSTSVLTWLACAFASLNLRFGNACSTATLRCGEAALETRYPTVTFRTLDWPDMGDPLMSNRGTILFEPPGSKLTGTIADYVGSTKFGFVSHSPQAGSARLLIEGMNEKGVSCSVLAQYSVAATTQADGGSSAVKVQIADACEYLLGNYGSVEEITAAIENGDFMIDASVPTSAEGAANLEALRLLTELVQPAGPGQLQYAVHLFITDGDTNGHALVYEGDQWIYQGQYATNVLANDPSLAEQTGRAQAYTGNLVQIPYNGDTRFERLYWTARADCHAWQFPENNDPSQNAREYKWSPGFGPSPRGMSRKTFMALKRAENVMYGFIVPRSPLWEDLDGLDTQAMYLKSHSDGLFYFRTPRDSLWQSIDIPQLSMRGERVEFEMYGDMFSTPATPTDRWPRLPLVD